jgi:bifunctional DNA-binding transcriptional regulator/antitoxin component of YhaV-PrlF toxin-antitoxin module
MANQNNVKVKNSAVATSVAKIGTKHQVVIPQIFFNDLRWGVGDYVEVKKEGNKLVLEAQQLIPKDQAWFWTKEWQEKEKQADIDFETGNVVGPFDNIDDALKALKTVDL